MRCPDDVRNPKSGRALKAPPNSQIIGRERRGRVSQLAWCGGGCFDSRRRQLRRSVACGEGGAWQAAIVAVGLSAALD